MNFFFSQLDVYDSFDDGPTFVKNDELHNNPKVVAERKMAILGKGKIEGFCT